MRSDNPLDDLFKAAGSSPPGYSLFSSLFLSSLNPLIRLAKPFALQSPDQGASVSAAGGGFPVWLLYKLSEVVRSISISCMPLNSDCFMPPCLRLIIPRVVPTKSDPRAIAEVKLARPFPIRSTQRRGKALQAPHTPTGNSVRAKASASSSRR